ncbi:diphthamide biosynthesis protein [Ganoderma leucocontextum]|nr:diphthamide biosynthesis protein [Ganoderma leucocontextum]
MAEITTFSSSGADVISRPIDLEEEIPDTLPQDQFEETYEITRTVQEVEKQDYKRIALQFPDELLPHSVPIFRALKTRTKEVREFYVLADTSYGSCCVDEVAAQHVDADALVHYGHACMSQTSRLPIIYVLGKKPVDPAHCVETFAEAVPNLSEKHSVVLKYDVTYAHQADAIIATLKSRLPPATRILHTPVPLIAQPASSEQHTPHHLQEAGVQPPTEPEASPEDSIILYIGGESLTVTNLLLTHASYEVYTYDPKTGLARLESGRTNKLLMRRYVVVQKARDADVIGILVGTLGVASYLPLIAHLRTIIKRAHKKSYTISVGKVNPAKLANFLEIEAFVLVACPENSLLDAREFLCPIVTPYELEVALQPRQTWTGRYVLDFEQLLREKKEGIDSEGLEDGSPGEPEDLDQPVFSLVSGKYRHVKRYGGTEEGASNGDVDSSALILRNQEDALSRMEDNAAAQFLHQRTYQGLETRIGQDAPSLLEQGRSGIARGYDDDHRVSEDVGQWPSGTRTQSGARSDNS